jgi:nucleoside-diphosphate-sugar epimerase
VQGRVVRVLVIGGTNFVGPHVVMQLIEAGHEVTIFHRGRTEADLPEGVGRIRGDQRRLADHANELRRLAPEVVLDMIPMNEKDARDVMSVLKGVARRVVAISSSDVYRAYDIVRRRESGLPDPVLLDEDAPLREKLYPYEGEGAEEYEKILVEKAVTGDSELPGTVLRLPAVYGPGDHQHRLFPYVKRMDDGRPVILLEEGMHRWRWTHGYVEDVAAAIALAVADERAAGRIYNVGEADPTLGRMGRGDRSRREVVRRGRCGTSQQATNRLRWEFDTDQHLFVDTTRIRRELGYEETVSREVALRRTVAWEREHPPVEVDPASFDYAAEDAALANLGW